MLNNMRLGARTFIICLKVNASGGKELIPLMYSIRATKT